MPDELRIGNMAPRDPEIGINFPFIVTIEHGALGLADMFAVTRAFDLYEMEKDLSDNEGLVKENILVDVLECTPTTTTVKVTPVETLSYALLGKHTELMIKSVAKKH